jgi:hypothetical protein
MKFLRWLFGSYYRREVNLRSGRQKRFGDKRQRDRPLGEDRPRSSNASGPRGSQGGVGILSHFAARDAAQAATAEMQRRPSRSGNNHEQVHRGYAQKNCYETRRGYVEETNGTIQEILKAGTSARFTIVPISFALPT